MASAGPRLVIYTRTDQQAELSPGDVWDLDRKFITGSNEDVRLHARNPPRVYYGHDGWLVYNSTSDQTLFLHGPTGRVDRIGPKSARTLEAGESTLRIVDLEVEFFVEDAMGSVESAHGFLPDPGVPITNSPQLAIENEIKDLLGSRPTFRIIIYTRFQEYILPLAVALRQPERAENPKPLNAADVVKCYPDVTEVQVHEASRTIRNVTGLNIHEIGPWLVDRGILLERHNIDIPHLECGHLIGGR